jgi:signal peptidase II
MRFLDRWLAAVIVALVVADWVSKYWLLRNVALGETRPMIDGWLYFAHRQNTGVAFSMFADLPSSWGQPLLIVVTLAAIVAFGWMLRTTTDRWSQFAIALVLGGAIGNLGDRALTGSVTDFVYVTFFPYVFNVADAAITVGGVLLGLRLLFAPQSQAPDPAAREHTAG